MTTSGRAATLTLIDHLQHLIDESATFRSAIADADAEARVPSCPDWSAADLLWHLTEVQHFWGTIVRDRLVEPDAYEPPERPADHLLDAFDDAHRRLTDALAHADDDVHVWTWAADARHVGFVRRRQAHEALVHRLDAELTVGRRTPFDPALAADGVDEALRYMFGGIPPWATWDEIGDTGRLEASDTGDAWHVRMGVWSGTSPESGTAYTAEVGAEIVAETTPTFVVSGTAGDLDAWLWGRPTLEPLRRSGDTSPLDELVATGVQ